MSLSGFANPRTPRQNGPFAGDDSRLFTPSGGIRGDLPPAELRSLLLERASQSRLASLLRPQGSRFNLPPLPKIPKATAAPSRANDPRISAAARRERQLAARRKGRASTILGGSVGDAAVVRSLLG